MYYRLPVHVHVFPSKEGFKPTPHHTYTCTYMCTGIPICTMQYFAFEVQINTGFPSEENVTKIQWFVMMLKTVTFVQASWRFIRIMFDYKKSPSLVKFHLLKKKKKKTSWHRQSKRCSKNRPIWSSPKTYKCWGQFPFHPNCLCQRTHRHGSDMIDLDDDLQLLTRSCRLPAIELAEISAFTFWSGKNDKQDRKIGFVWGFAMFIL